MPDKYTPTTEEVREAYALADPERAEFDRWLAQHDADVLAAADRVTVAPDREKREKAADFVRLRFGDHTLDHLPWAEYPFKTWWLESVDALLASGVLGVPADQTVDTSSAQVDGYGNYYCPLCKSWLPLDGNWGATALQEHVGELHD